MKTQKKLVARMISIQLLLVFILVFSTDAKGQDVGSKQKVLDLKSLIGNWEGTVNAGSMKFTFVFKFWEDEKSLIKGTLDLLEQNAIGIPINEIIVRNDSLLMDFKEMNRKYAGKIRVDNNTIEGIYIRSGAPSLPLNIRKVDSVTQLKRPQTPKPPFPYKSEDIQFSNPSDGVTLTGTLTLPAEAGSYPSIILLSGSGAQDRDETIFEHKPFLVLADFLTRQGFAVMRYDDRGIGGSSGDHLQATTRINAGDVHAAIDFLGSRKDIIKNKIILIGHSEGAIIASMVAAEDNRIDRIVLLGAPGLTIEENLYLQNALIRKADGIGDAVIAQFNTLQKKIFTVVKEEPNDSIARSKLRDIYSSNRYSMLNQDQKNSVDGRISNLLTPYFRDILACDPGLILNKVKCPILAITGEKDLQAPPAENLPAIETALKTNGNNTYKLVQIPGLNHMLQTCQTGSLSEYSTIEETINPIVLETILDWLAKEKVNKSKK